MTFSFWSSRPFRCLPPLPEQSCSAQPGAICCMAKGSSNNLSLGQKKITILNLSWHTAIPILRSEVRNPLCRSSLSFHNPMVRLCIVLQIWQPLNATPPWNKWHVLEIPEMVGDLQDWHIYSDHLDAQLFGTLATTKKCDEQDWVSSKRRSNSNLHH